MFTVCPKCALTLVVTAADLRVAQGYVRCGRCLNVFNALARLSEERPGAPVTEAAAAAAKPVEQDAPEHDAPPQSAVPSAPSAPSDTSGTSAADSTADITGEIEFELDASVIVTSARAPTELREAVGPDARIVQEQEPAEEPVQEQVEPAQEPVPAVAAPPSTATAASADLGTQPVSVVPEAAAQQSLEPRTEEQRSEALSHVDANSAAPDAQQTNTEQPRHDAIFEIGTLRPRAGLPWMLGAAALVIALALQIVNHYRDALAAASPALRGPLSTVYSALGVKLAPRWNIHAYDVRQLGASVAGAAAGEIIVRASVKNTANSAQPLPLLRVTLQDRFGNRIAARDVPPPDYLPSSVAPSTLLAAGSRVDATMVFVDPGPQAVGFEIDACLQRQSGEVACAHGP